MGGALHCLGVSHAVRGHRRDSDRSPLAAPASAAVAHRPVEGRRRLWRHLVHARGGGVRTQLGTLRESGQGKTSPERAISIRLADPDKPDIRTGTVSRTLAELVHLSPVDSRTGWSPGSRRALHSCHDRGSRQAAHQFQFGIGTPIGRFCLGVPGLHDGRLALVQRFRIPPTIPFAMLRTHGVVGGVPA